MTGRPCHHRGPVPTLVPLDIRIRTEMADVVKNVFGNAAVAACQCMG